MALKSALLLVSPLVLAGTSIDKVYQCGEGEHTVFSQLPCSYDAKPLKVKVIQGDPLAAENPDFAKQLEKLKQYIEQQGASQQISRHHRAIKRYKKQLADEFGQLKDIRYRTAEDKNAAIKALSAKYDALIIKEQEAIKRLSVKKSDNP